MNKNIIIKLKELDTSYIFEYIEYINDKFKYMVLGNTPEENPLFTKNVLTSVRCRQHTSKQRLFNKHGITKVQKNAKSGAHLSKKIRDIINKGACQKSKEVKFWKIDA